MAVKRLYCGTRVRSEEPAGVRRDEREPERYAVWQLAVVVVSEKKKVYSCAVDFKPARVLCQTH